MSIITIKLTGHSGSICTVTLMLKDATRQAFLFEIRILYLSVIKIFLIRP